MKYDYAIKKGTSLIWLVTEAKDEIEATKRAREVLKAKSGYLLYAGPLPKINNEIQ